jgi:hypothetical protein
MSLTSYPIAIPATPGTASITIRKQSVVAVATSPFSLSSQSQTWAGQIWYADISLPRMARANGETWAAALSSLNGKEGSLLIGDTANKTPRGIGTGTPLVNGGGQSGYTLNTKGWTASKTGIMKAGDWLQLGAGATARLYKVIFDANSDAGGLASLTVWPQLRSSPADSAAITIAPAQGKFMLAKEPEWTIGADHIYTFSPINLVEDLR